MLNIKYRKIKLAQEILNINTIEKSNYNTVSTTEIKLNNNINLILSKLETIK